MLLTPIRSAAGLALLAAVAAGCGTAAAHHPASHHPAPAHAAAHPATRAATPIPQGNGGDHDGDNNGGPSDRDGSI